MEHKHQHWIPQGYLKAWADPAAPLEQESWVWQFDRDGRQSRRKPPRKIFFENDLYTLGLDDGIRDLRIERGLGGLEDQFVRIREEKLQRRLPLVPDEDLVLRAFVGAMQARTPPQLDHWRATFDRLAEKGREIQAAVDAGNRTGLFGSISSGGPSLSQEDVESLANAARGELVFPMLQAQLPILRRMNLSVLETDDAIGFITSDSPCVWVDPVMSAPPFPEAAPGLGSASVEVSLPVSPSQLLLLSWQVRSGYLSLSGAGVDEINRRTRLHCKEHFVVRQAKIKSEWFQEIVRAG
jgi:hypothetical protein